MTWDNLNHEQLPVPSGTSNIKRVNSFTQTQQFHLSFTQTKPLNLN